MDIERKTEKKNLYEDARNEMDDWDQEELEEVITKKHGDQNKGLPPTTIVCFDFVIYKPCLDLQVLFGRC